MRASRNNTSLNILHLTAVKNWGGGGNHVENLCYELSKSNPEIKNLIVVAEGGQFHERLKKSRFNFETLPMSFKMDPRAIFKIIRLCRRERIDLIHIHGSTSLTLAVIADRISSLPPFVFSKKTSFPIKKRKQTLYKYNHPKVKKILCVSEATNQISQDAIADHRKLKTIYHGTRIDNKSSETLFNLRDKYDLSSEVRLIGSIGNHIKAKDLDTWIDTIDLLINEMKVPNLRFIQIGSFSDMTPGFKERIKKLGLENYIHFLGYLPNASNFIPQFNLLLLTSKSEGLPQVIYEAFYHKTPVVSTNVGGIPEIVTHQSNGLISAKGDAASLANNLRYLLDNPELGMQFAEKGVKKLFPKFTAENMATETLRVYKDILKKN